MAWSWAKASPVATSCAERTDRTAAGRCPSYRGFSSRRTWSYVGSDGRASRPRTERPSRCQSAFVGALACVDVAVTEADAIPGPPAAARGVADGDGDDES